MSIGNGGKIKESLYKNEVFVIMNNNSTRVVKKLHESKLNNGKKVNFNGILKESWRD